MRARGSFCADWTAAINFVGRADHGNPEPALSAETYLSPSTLDDGTASNTEIDTACPREPDAFRASFPCWLDEDRRRHSGRRRTTAQRRSESSQSKEINKQDGACIARGPVPVSALRFLPGEIVEKGKSKDNA